MTRNYAKQRLEESGDASELRRRHATFVLETLKNGERFERRKARSLSGVVLDLDDVRAAFDWAFSPSGDATVVVGLAASSAQIWLGVGLLVECRELMRRAVGYLQLGEAQPVDELRIQSALGALLMYTVGVGDEFEATFQRVFAIAEGIADVDGQMIALLGLWGQQIREPNFERGLKYAEKALSVATSTDDSGKVALADWMMGLCRHHLGQQSKAQIHLQSSLSGDTEVSRRAQLALIGYDRKTDALGVLSNALWVQGFTDQALRLGRLSVTEASLLDLAVPNCVAGVWHGFNLYLTTTDLASAEAQLSILADYARRNSIESYEGLAKCLAALCLAGREPIETISRSITTGLNLLERSRYKVLHPIIQAWLAGLYASAGQFVESAIILNSAKKEDNNPQYWCRPEIHRVEGEINLAKGDFAAAEEDFSQALQIAASQGALAWELRAATSSAKLLLLRGFGGKAHAVLEPIFSRFVEGFDTRDYIVARDLLQSIERG